MKHSPKIVAAWFAAQHIPAAQPEYRFNPARRWRFDYAWPCPTHKVALEIEGGVWIAGRHSRGKGMVRDMEKYNAATLLGWRILRVTPEQLLTAQTASMLREAIFNWTAPKPI